MNNTISFSLAILLLSTPIAVSSGCSNTRTLGAQSDDAAVKMRVGQRLTADPEVRRFKIDVDVLDGVVTLRGSVDSQAMADEAEKLAKNTEGVTEVVNQLKVGSDGADEQERSDLSLKTAVGTRLSADPDVRRLNIDVDVIDGVVYLSGVVNDQQAKDSAERIASGVDGVLGVENELRVVASEVDESAPETETDE